MKGKQRRKAGRPPELIERLRRSHLEALLSGDRRGADICLEQARRSGAEVLDIYLRILIANQTALGELWHAGEINTAEEHEATEITLEQMNRLRLDFPVRDPLPYEAVVTSVEGEQHAVAVRVVADFLLFHGWRVHYLGPGTPALDLARFVGSRNIALVALSVTLEANLPAVKRTAMALRENPRCPKIVIGGAALKGLNDRDMLLGVDAVCNDISEIASLARSLVDSGSGREESGEAFLHALGSRIQSRRKSLGMSQQELADAAGLTRVFLSAIENGKDNVSILSLAKIAKALRTNLSELLRV